jgi:hypothetical protein
MFGKKKNMSKEHDLQLLSRWQENNIENRMSKNGGLNDLLRLTSGERQKHYREQ